MKNLSYWAREHKQAARLIIVISFILLTFLGFITGGLLTDLNFKITYEAYLTSAIIYCSIFLIYPSATQKKKWGAALFYLRQKSCDFLLTAVTFFIIIYVGNNPENLFKYFPSVNASSISVNIVPKDSSVNSYKSIKEFSLTMKGENGKTLKWKERKKLLKKQVRAIKNSEVLSKGGKTGLIILSILVALGLIYLVATIACSLSCNGSEAAAVIVGIGGTGLIIFLTVLMIKYIQKKGRKKNKEETEET